MANKKITELTDGTPIATDIAPYVSDPGGTPVTKKTTFQHIADFIAGLTQTLVGKTLTSPLFKGSIDGWISADETWAYASATTITVPSGAASKYQRNDKIRFQNNDSGTYLYAYIITVADTLLTVIGDVVPNATLTDNYYSHSENPMGFPHLFSITPAVVGWSGSPTIVARFSITGRKVFYTVYVDGTSNSATKTVALPVAAVNIANLDWGGVNLSIMDNDAWVTTASKNYIPSAATTTTIYKDMVATGFTTSGRCIVRFSIFYGI
jgi:hypothetical protein